MFGVHGPPSPGSIWITTGLGDVFVFDPAVLEVRIILIGKQIWAIQHNIIPYHITTHARAGEVNLLFLFIYFNCIHSLVIWRN
jgi:hypothetical protein